MDDIGAPAHSGHHHRVVDRYVRIIAPVHRVSGSSHILGPGYDISQPAIEAIPGDHLHILWRHIRIEHRTIIATTTASSQETEQTQYKEIWQEM